MTSFWVRAGSRGLFSGDASWKSWALLRDGKRQDSTTESGARISTCTAATETKAWPPHEPSMQKQLAWAAAATSGPEPMPSTEKKKMLANAAGFSSDGKTCTTTCLYNKAGSVPPIPCNILVNKSEHR